MKRGRQKANIPSKMVNGRLIGGLRESRNMTQQELADAAFLTRRTVWLMESEQPTSHHRSTIRAVAHVLGCDERLILSKQPEPSPPRSRACRRAMNTSVITGEVSMILDVKMIDLRAAFKDSHRRASGLKFESLCDWIDDNVDGDSALKMYGESVHGAFDGCEVDNPDFCDWLIHQCPRMPEEVEHGNY